MAKQYEYVIFFQNDYCLEAFMIAHNESINNKKMKLIVILVDNPSLDPLKDELKTYITSKSNLNWGNKWFWDKLRYRMPHIIREPRKTDPWSYFKRLSNLSNRNSRTDRVSDVRMSELTYQESPPGVRVSATSANSNSVCLEDYRFSGDLEDSNSVYSIQSVSQEEQVELDIEEQDSDALTQRSSEISALMNSTGNGYNTDVIEYNAHSDEEPKENDNLI